MATVSWVIFKHHKKTDGTYNPKIRISHNSTSSYLSTQIYTELVKFRKGSASGILMTGDIEDLLNEIVKKYRKILNDNIELISSCENSKDVVAIIQDNMMKSDNIDFIKYTRKKINEIKNEGTRSVKTTGINSLCHYLKFVGEESLPIKNLTSDFLTNYDSWLRTERVLIVNGNKNTNRKIAKISPPLYDTGVHNYMSTIQSLFNDCLDEFNDYEKGNIVIKNNPFKKYSIPTIKPAKKRANGVELIREISEFSQKNKRRKTSTFARDVYMLSFYLAGLNSADMHGDLIRANNGRLEYERRKTRDRRDDDAFISIKIIPEAQELIHKYRDKSGRRLLCFYHKYADIRAFTKAIHRGLRSMCEDMEIEPIQFYSARHSFATIARNKCGVSKDDVNLALNHAAFNSSEKMADTYIDVDYDLVDNVIDKVMEYTFKEK